MNEDQKVNKELEACHSVVIHGDWETVKKILYDRLEEKISPLNYNSSLSADELKVQILVAQEMNKLLNDWIGEVETNYSTWEQEKNQKPDEGYVRIY